MAVIVDYTFKMCF